MRDLVNAAIDPEMDMVSGRKIADKVVPVMRERLLPAFRSKWAAHGSPHLKTEHGFGELWRNLTTGNAADEDLRRLTELLCVTSSEGCWTQINRNSFFPKEKIVENFERVVREFFLDGRLHEVRSFREASSSYTGKRLPVSVSAFVPFIARDPSIDDPDRIGARDVVLNSNETSMVVITSFDRSPTLHEILFHHVDDINYGKGREQANRALLDGAGIAMMFVSQDQPLSVKVREEGFEVYLGNAEPARSMISGGAVVVAEADVIKRLVGEDDLRAMVEAGDAAILNVPEGSKMRVMVRDETLMRDPYREDAERILSAGAFPMPAMAELASETRHEDLRP